MQDKISLVELKERVLNDNTLSLSLIDKIGVILCDNREYIYKILKRQNDKSTN